MGLLTTEAALASFVDGVLSAKDEWIALDTEFSRRDTYFPKLSLIQLASTSKTVVIDALAEINFEPLRKILENPRILKVSHAGGQDIEAIYHKLKLKVDPVVDIQVMAAFVSRGKNLSLEKLAALLLNAKIDKSSQNSDWLKRPLNPAQLAYAANDAAHVAKIYPILKAESIAIGRWEWVLEETLNFAEKTLFPPEKEWLKFCAPNFGYTEFLLAYVVIGWREKIARESDKTRRAIMPNPVAERLIKLKRPEIYATDYCPKAYADDFLTAWNSVETLAKDAKIRDFVLRAVNERYAETSPSLKEESKNLATRLEKIAAELNLPADLLLSKRERTRAVETKGESLTGWRERVLAPLFRND